MHPVLFSMKSVTIYTYGFFVALAMLAVFLLADRRASSLGISRAIVIDLIFLLFVSGVVGARLFFVAQHFEDYREHFWKLFSIQEGGLVWYGGFLTAAFLGLVYASARKWPLLPLCDFFAPLLALAHGIGRLGCFLNGCCFGKVTDSALGVTFPGDSVARHPVQLYEAVFLFILSAFLFYLSSKKKRDGDVFIGYLIFYGVFRFFIEFLRGDQTLLAGLTYPQWTSILLFAGGIFLMIQLSRKKRIR